MSDYVRGLRAKIGHDLLLMPTVAARILDEDGRLLLVFSVEGQWQLPGGAVEPGETPADAIRRECLEEVSIEIRLVAVAGVFGGSAFEYTYSNGDRIAFVLTLYDAEVVDGAPAPGDDEIEDVGWFASADLNALELAPATRAILRDS